ncbi:MAG: NAD(P)-dependent oxidoreductase [Vicinamibacteraceae bacterium]
MSSRDRILLVNRTCLDVLEDHREWLAGLDVEVTADPSWHGITAAALDDVLKDADGVVGPSPLPLTPERMERARRLRVISLASSGFDSVDVVAATRMGIVVTIAPVPELAEVVADLTWGLLLAVARQIPLHDKQIRAGDLRRGMAHTPWRKTLGIVGLGHIGRAVARRAVGFEMTLLATEPLPDADFVARHDIQMVTLDELLSRSDFVSLHVRINDDTRRMIGRAELAKMPPTAFVVNTARRELIDEDALVERLSEGLLAGAGLDDPPARADSPLLGMDNVVLTTHLGNRARVGVDMVLRCAVQNAADVLAGKRCEFTVNPDVYRGTVRQPMLTRNRP